MFTMEPAGRIRGAIKLSSAISKLFAFTLRRQLDYFCNVMQQDGTVPGCRYITTCVRQESVFPIHLSSSRDHTAIEGGSMSVKV